MTASFGVGSMVIYPYHGVAEIVAEEAHTVDGVTSAYFRLAIRDRDADSPQGLVISVPADRAGDVGLRWPLPREDAASVLEVLAKTDVSVPSNWSRRFKNHQEKLKSGDLFECAEVVRNLSARMQVKALAPAETSMYQHARHTLVSELMLTWDVGVTEAERRIDTALQP